MPFANESTYVDEHIQLVHRCEQRDSKPYFFWEELDLHTEKRSAKVEGESKRLWDLVTDIATLLKHRHNSQLLQHPHIHIKVHHVRTACPDILDILSKLVTKMQHAQ
jgi:hypothetical protein